MARVVMVLSCLLAAPAAAVAQCAPRADVLAQLADRYGEARRGIGLSDGNVMEVFAAASGSWTVTMTTAHGLTCLIASGDGWEAIAEPFPAQGVPG
jgi:hypothetical protein